MANLEETAGRGESGGETATTHVAEALARRILEQMAPGASMPSEAEIATEFGVSRLTVREAFKLLAGRGLIEVSRGRRAIVRQPTGGAFSDFLSTIIRNDPKGLFDLIELRMSLEVQAATLAAKRASRASIAAIESALQGMRDAAEAGRRNKDDETSERRFHRSDVGFHEAVALASGNRLISHIFEAMAGSLERSFPLSRRGHQLRGNSVEDTIAAHNAILEAIREGNPKAAGTAMFAHIEDTERDIRAGLEARPAIPIEWN